MLQEQSCGTGLFLDSKSIADLEENSWYCWYVPDKGEEWEQKGGVGKINVIVVVSYLYRDCQLEEDLRKYSWGTSWYWCYGSKIWWYASNISKFHMMTADGSCACTRVLMVAVRDCAGSLNFRLPAFSQSTLPCNPISHLTKVQSINIAFQSNLTSINIAFQSNLTDVSDTDKLVYLNWLYESTINQHCLIFRQCWMLIENQAMLIVQKSTELHNSGRLTYLYHSRQSSLFGWFISNTERPGAKQIYCTKRAFWRNPRLSKSQKTCPVRKFGRGRKEEARTEGGNVEKEHRKASRRQWLGLILIDTTQSIMCYMWGTIRHTKVAVISPQSPHQWLMLLLLLPKK